MDEEGGGDGAPNVEQTVTGKGGEEEKGKGWRVKLYQLNAEGQWDDQGTGYITCKEIKNSGGKAFLVLSEVDEKEMLQCMVVDDDVYQRQGDNIITWCEPAVPGSGGVDLALSFQDNEGCSEIWGQICEVQGRYCSTIFRGNQDAGSSGSGDESGGLGVSDSTHGMSSRLPVPTMENLEAIRDQLSTATLLTRDSLAASVCDNNGQFITKLLEVFDDCEDFNNVEGLQKICMIFKALFSLNDGNVLDALLSDKFFIPVTGVFEYDPQLGQKATHREWFRKSVKFKEVLPIKDADVLSRIHQNFRVVFLKDVLLRRLMDDNVVSTLNSVICYNNAEIITALYVGSDYLKNVFALLPSEKGNAEEKGSGGVGCGLGTSCTGENGVAHPSLQGGESGGLPSPRECILRFIRELFESSKTLHPTPREDLFRYLWNEVPLFDVMTPVLADPEATELELTCCFELVLHTLQHDSSMLRTHVIQRCIHPPPPPSYNGHAGGDGKDQFGTHFSVGSGSGGVTECAAPTLEKCNSLLFWVIRRLTSEKSSLGILTQAADVCRIMLDVETMESQLDRDSFLGVFYDHYIHWLVQPLRTTMECGNSNNCNVVRGGVRREHQSAGFEAMDLSIKGHVCDLLGLCVEGHTYRMKYYIIRNHVANLVLKLLDQPSKYLQLTALRFLRRCVGVKDQVYNRYIIKNSLLAPIFAILKGKNSPRDNLFTSAVAELVEFVRSENMKSLIEYIVENFAPILSHVKWIPAFQGIITKYEQNRDYVENVERELQHQTSGSGGVGGVVGGERGDGAITGSSLNRSGASSTKRFTEEDQDEAYFNESDDEDDANESYCCWEVKGENIREGDEQGDQPGETPTAVSSIHKCSDEKPPPPLLPLRRSVPHDSDDGEDDDEPFKLRALNNRGAVPSVVPKSCPPSKIRVKMSSSFNTLGGGGLAKGGDNGEDDGRVHQQQQQSELPPSTSEEELKQHKEPPPHLLDGGGCSDNGEESTSPPECARSNNMEDCEESA